MAGDDVVGSTTPELYSLRDLGGPRASIRLSREESRVDCTALSNCLVCLLDRSSIVPLRCCGKAVCDECLKRYISSQVRWFWAVVHRYTTVLVLTCGNALFKVFVGDRLFFCSTNPPASANGLNPLCCSPIPAGGKTALHWSLCNIRPLFF